MRFRGLRPRFTLRFRHEQRTGPLTGLPAIRKFAQMRAFFSFAFQSVQQVLHRDVMAGRGHPGTEIRPAQIQHKGIEHIALAIAVNGREIARLRLLRHVWLMNVPLPRQPHTKATVSGIPIASERTGLDERPIKTVNHDLIAFGIGMNRVRTEFWLTQHGGKDLPDHQHPFLFP